MNVRWSFTIEVSYTSQNEEQRRDDCRTKLKIVKSRRRSLRRVVQSDEDRNRGMETKSSVVGCIGKF